MQLIRGRATDPVQDRELTAQLLERAAGGVRGVRVWAPPRQVAFGRRDTRASGYDRARRTADRAGFAPIERSVGGRAVAYSGETLAFAVAAPRDGRRESIDDRYAAVGQAVRQALQNLGAAVASGEPTRSFCPGDHSIRVEGGGKVIGLAQRVRADAALVAGCLVPTVTDSTALGQVLTHIYDALAVDFDPGSVGSVEAAGGPADADRVQRAIEAALCVLTCERDEYRGHTAHTGAGGSRTGTRVDTDETAIAAVTERFSAVTITRAGEDMPAADERS